MSFKIRDYKNQDADEVGRLIAETYAEFNLDFLSPEERSKFLGPFQHAVSPDPEHRRAIAEALKSPICYVAESGGRIVGVLRGRRERLASLFVHRDFHQCGVGRRLVARFEKESAQLGVLVIRVAATLYAVPFYLKLGYKRSTGVRNGWSFEGPGLPVQPMKKKIGPPPPQGK